MAEEYAAFYGDETGIIILANNIEDAEKYAAKIASPLKRVVLRKGMSWFDELYADTTEIHDITGDKLKIVDLKSLM